MWRGAVKASCDSDLSNKLFASENILSEAFPPNESEICYYSFRTMSGKAERGLGKPEGTSMLVLVYLTATKPTLCNLLK